MKRIGQSSKILNMLLMLQLLHSIMWWHVAAVLFFRWNHSRLFKKRGRDADSVLGGMFCLFPSGLPVSDPST